MSEKEKEKRSLLGQNTVWALSPTKPYLIIDGLSSSHILTKLLESWANPICLFPVAVLQGFTSSTAWSAHIAQVERKAARR